MKKSIILLCCLFAFSASIGQQIQQARNYIATNIVTNGANQITAIKLNTALNLMLNADSINYQIIVDSLGKYVLKSDSSTRFITPTQMAVGLATKQNTLGYIAESTSNKTTDANGTSNALYPTQGAVKSYVDAQSSVAVKYTDTASMLTPYLRKEDTSNISTRIDGKLNIFDTANIRLRPIAGLNMTISGTYPNLTFAANSGGIATDTLSLSNRIDARVKHTDTAAMLATYARKSLVTDTAAAIRAAFPSVTGKVNYTDTAAMLVGYAKIQRLLDTALAIQARLNLKLNIANPTATGTLTAPAVTISGLTAGSASDSVVTVNAATGVLYRRAFPAGSVGSGISGLSTNYVPKATSSTTIGNSTIQDNGTNVGINSAPTAANRLHVNNGSLSVSGGFRTDNPGVGAATIMGNDGSFGFIQTYGSTPLVLNASFAPVMTGVMATATSQFTSVSDGYTHSGGYSDVISAKSTNYPSITLRETGSGFGNGWFWGLVGGVSKFIPFVNPRSASVEMGYNGTSEGVELRSAADIQGITYFNSQSYKVWNQWNIGTNAIPSSAPQGSFVTYGGDIGYAHIITKEGRHIMASPASADDGVNKLQVEGGVRINGNLNNVTYPVHADNAAATAAGLPVGRHYRTPTGVVMVRF